MLLTRGVSDSAFFDRLPATVFNLVRLRPSSTHLTRKSITCSTRTRGSSQSTSLWVLVDKNRVVLFPFEIGELPECHANPVSVNRFWFKIQGLEADRLVLFLHG